MDMIRSPLITELPVQRPDNGVSSSFEQLILPLPVALPLHSGTSDSDSPLDSFLSSADLSRRQGAWQRAAITLLFV
uniref:Uncharacterized protein n=1 Tax=Steinernema glaseri TaxID=37863 RepID=A0A1I7YVV1_9BILA